MKRKTAITLASLVVASVFAVSQDLIPTLNETMKLSHTGMEYEVTGIGESGFTKAAIINQKIVSEGMMIDHGLVLSDVEMEAATISADSVEVTLSL